MSIFDWFTRRIENACMKGVNNFLARIQALPDQVEPPVVLVLEHQEERGPARNGRPKAEKGA